MQFTLDIRRGIRIALGTLGVAVLAVAPFVNAAPTDAATINAQPVAVHIMSDMVTASPDTIRTGQVTFQVTNRTGKVQDFHIDGPNVDTDLEDIAAGGTRSVTMMVSPGNYRLQAEDDDGNNERVSRMIVMP